MGVTPTINFVGIGEAECVSWSVIQRLNAPGHVRAVCHGAATKSALEALRDTGFVLCEALLDGVIKSRCMLTYPALHLAPPTELTIDQDDIWEAYKYTGVDRVIAHTTSMQAVAKQIFEETPGIGGMAGASALAFAHVLGALSVPVSDDLNAVMVETAVATLARIIGAASSPEFGFYFADAGGDTPTCYIGASAGGGGFAFTDHTRDIEVTWQPDHRAMYSQFAIVGGSSTHGLPQGFQITGACTYGPSFLIAGRVSDNLGGVYQLGDLNFFPASPVNIGINDMFLASNTMQVFISTAHGAYVAANISNQAGNVYDWALIGKYGGLCQSVCADGDFVYMAVSGVNAGINGLYGCMRGGDGGYGPILSGQTGRNHDGWSNLYSQDVLMVAASQQMVFYVLAADPTNVWLYKPSGAHEKMAGGGTFAITKLVSTFDRVYVLGGKGVMQIFPGGTAPIMMALDLPSAQDQNGNPIAVGSVTNVVATAAGGTWYCTDQGVLVGGRMCLPGMRVDYAGQGTTFGSSGGIGGTMYATDGTRIFDSNSAGTNWRDILNQPVTPHAALPNASSAPVTNGWQALSNASDGNRYYRYIQGGPPFSPYGNLLFSDAPSIQAGGILTPKQASQFLVHITERLARQYQKPIETFTLRSVFDDSGSRLASLKPTAQVSFDYHRNACDGDPGITLGRGGLYVIEHEVSVDRQPFATTRTVAATSMCQQAYTAEEIAKATLYLFGQQARAK